MKRRIWYSPEGRNLEDAYNRRYGMDFYGYDFQEELAGPNGMHYHVWIKKSNPKDERAELEALYSRAARDRDIVGMSYAYLPDEET